MAVKTKNGHSGGRSVRFGGKEPLPSCHAHPRPPPGQSRRRLPLVEEGLWGGGEQGVLEERAATQAGPPQRVKALTLVTAHSLGHCGPLEGRLQDEKWRRSMVCMEMAMKHCGGGVLFEYLHNILYELSVKTFKPNLNMKHWLLTKCWGIICFMADW